jgi:L-amino acid N-acyltransferase YncA
MIELRYRNAEIPDLERIVEIYNSTIESGMVTADTDPVSVKSRREWFHRHSADRRPLWVIQEDSDDIIGWISFQSFYGRPAYDATSEVSIYLAAEKRRKGLGGQVLAHVLSEAPKFGVKTLLGFIFAHNEPSLRLFRKFGFEEWAHLPNIALIQHHERSLKVLGKRIG